MDDGFSLKKKLLKKRTLISFIVAFIALYLVFRGINLKETWNIFLKANLFLLLLAFFAHYFTYIIRAIRWRALLWKIGVKGKVWDLSVIAFLGQFANCIIPAKLGDIYCGYLIKKNYGSTTSKSLGTIFVSRFLDLIVLVIFLLLAGIFIYGQNMPGTIFLVIEVSAVLSLMVIVFLFFFRYKGEIFFRLTPKRFQNIVSNFADGTKSLSRKLLPKLVFLTFVLWLFEILRFYIVSWSLGFKMSFGLAIFIALAVSLITTIPITPSGLGAAEAAIVGVLLLAGIDKNLAFSIAIMDRIIGFWSQLAVGAFVYFFSRKV